MLLQTLFEKKFLIKAVKFGITGFTGLVIDFSITWLLKEKVGINPYISNASGFTAAVINNYLLNKRWTFEDKSRQIAKQFSGFLIVSLIGLVLNTFFLYLFNHHLGIQFYASKGLAILIVFVWNFLANNFLIFRTVEKL